MSPVSATAAVIGIAVDRARPVPPERRRSFIAGAPQAFPGADRERRAIWTRQR